MEPKNENANREKENKEETRAPISMEEERGVNGLFWK